MGLHTEVCEKALQGFPWSIAHGATCVRKSHCAMGKSSRDFPMVYSKLRITCCGLPYGPWEKVAWTFPWSIPPSVSPAPHLGIDHGKVAGLSHVGYPPHFIWDKILMGGSHRLDHPEKGPPPGACPLHLFRKESQNAVCVRSLCDANTKHNTATRPTLAITKERDGHFKTLASLTD